MQLQARLRETTLGDLLGAIYRAGLSGTLELTEERGPTAGRVHALHVKQGRIVQVHSPLGKTRLGEVLAERGWLDKRAVLALVERTKDSNTPFGQRLVEAGILPDEAVLEAIRTQICERLEAIFHIADARVAFRLVQTRRRELDVRCPLEPGEYLVGRPRARDRIQSCAATSPRTEGELERRRDLLILGLGPGADSLAIRGAFRRLAASLHPDRHPDARPDQIQALQRRFADVSAAYHRLAG